MYCHFFKVVYFHMHLKISLVQHLFWTWFILRESSLFFIFFTFIATNKLDFIIQLMIISCSDKIIDIVRTVVWAALINVLVFKHGLLILKVPFESWTPVFSLTTYNSFSLHCHGRDSHNQFAKFWCHIWHHMKFNHVPSMTSSFLLGFILFTCLGKFYWICKISSHVAVCVSSTLPSFIEVVWKSI